MNKFVINAGGTKFCSQCKCVKTQKGGAERLINKGRQTRWICADCRESIAKRVRDGANAA